jgi:tripartite-type tricarboxylate transporter receptor subunit TctC
VRPTLPAKSVQELVALAKKQPGKLSFGQAGLGTASHIPAEMMLAAANIAMLNVPYKGTPNAMTDLLGGHIDMFFIGTQIALPLVQEGKVRALAVTGLKRSEIFPNLPTVAETGLPGFEAVLHYGIVAPAGTPRPIIDKLSAALREAVNAPDTKERMAKDGTEPLLSTPEEYAADIDREEIKWSAVVRQSGAKGE